jgi:hypothetical protein
MLLAAWRGEESLARELIERLTRAATEYGVGRMVDVATYTGAVLHNGTGRYEAARDARGRRSSTRWRRQRAVIVAELAEAASRTGDRALVEAAVDALAVRTQSIATTGCWGSRPASVRCWPTVTPLSAIIVRRSSTSVARACAWSWHGRTCSTENGSAARGAGWTRASSCAPRTTSSARSARTVSPSRTRHELLATGETVRKRRDDTRDDLTPQEEHIARLALSGRSNPRSAPSSSSARAPWSGISKKVY